MVLALFFLILPENVGSDYEMLSEALTGDGTTSLGMALSVVIAAPIAEDLLMRGVALNYGRKYMNDTAAVIFSSLAFGCMHFSNISMAPLSGVLIQVIYASIMGAVLAVVAIRFKSVWASVFVHFIINGSGQLLSLLTGNSEKGDIVGYCFYGVGIIALVVIVIMLIKNKVPSPEAPTYGELAAAKAAAVGEVTE